MSRKKIFLNVLISVPTTVFFGWRPPVTKNYYSELINIFILGFSNKNGDYGGASYYGSYFYQSGNPYRSEKHNGQFVSQKVLTND